MRISSFDLYNRVQMNINGVQRTLANQQFKLATGKEFNKASENPIKAKQVEVIREALGRVNQYEKNINDAKGILETTVTSLTSAYNVLEKANNEMLKASNEVNNSEDLKTIAMVIEKNIEQLITIGNSKHLNRYIFSGEKILDKPFDYNGTTVTYNGNDNDVKMDISPYVETTVINSGNVVLTKTIQDLIKIRDQITAGDRAGLTVSMDAHKQNMDNLMNHVADIGVRIDGLDVTKSGYDEQKVNLEARRSETEDIDFVQVMIDYSITQRTYQASLKATSMMFQTSILDYI